MSRPSTPLPCEITMKTIVDNKKAFREVDVTEKFEAGLVLTGTEIKSIRAGQVVIGQSFIRLQRGEGWLINCNISEYTEGSWNNHTPTRKRKLLLHKREIKRLQGRVEEKGFTVVPLRLYLNERGLAKLQIGLGRGKKIHDKRRDLKTRDMNREIQRAMRNR